MNSTINTSLHDLPILNSTNASQTFNLIDDYSNLEAIIVPIVFCVIFVTGIIGNGILLVYLIRGRKNTSPHNIYVISLAVGDLLMVTVSMPFMSTIFTFKSWPYGETMCKISEFFHTLCCSVTVYMLTALSVERTLIVIQRQPKNRNTSAVIVVFVIWLYSFMYAIPDLITANLYGRSDSPMCLLYKYSWGLAYAKTLTVHKLLFLFAVPVVISITCYVIIIIKLARAHNNDQSALQSSISNQKKIRLICLIITLVLLFIVSWLPRRIFLVWFYFDSSSYTMSWHAFKVTGFCLMYANSALNPIVFYALDPGIRTYVTSCCCNRRQYTSINGVNVNKGDVIELTEMSRVNDKGSIV